MQCLLEEGGILVNQQVETLAPKTGRPTVEPAKEPAGYPKAPLPLANTVHVYFGVGRCVDATASMHACMSVLLPVCVFSSTQDNRGG